MNTATSTFSGVVQVPHIVAGRLIEDYARQYPSAGGGSFITPALNLDAMVLPRSELPPCYGLPLSEIIDFLVATGKRLSLGSNRWLTQAIDSTVAINPLPRRVVENIYREIPVYFERQTLEFELENALGGHAVSDGWKEVVDPTGRRVSIKAFPSRMVHILAGNSPSVTATSITRSALSKGISLLKLPSNDLLTASAILRTMADVDPNHPVLRSLSAVYWRGGDSSVENIIYRPQYFDKIVVWGGEAAVRNVVKYLGPGIQMIAFDPKVSMSIIGREAHASASALRTVADLAAEDVQLLNQEACAASRFQFIEGTLEQVDRYCEALCTQLHVDRVYGSAKAAPPPTELRTELESLRHFEPEYRLWGDTGGGGMVVRSPEPMSFHPIGKVVNVIAVSHIEDAISFASPATQTVGVWPTERKREVRDRLFAAGVQRVVALGTAHKLLPGLPHDGFLPLHRLVNWVADEG